MNCLILTSPNSWFNKYIEKLSQCIKTEKPEANITLSHEPIEGMNFDICLILSYEKILKDEFLKSNKYNLVVHASDLPKGKGMSPVTWQILEGMNSIPLTLFEAHKDLDAGDIYLQSSLEFNGLELVDEIREIQAQGTIKLVADFFKEFPNITARKQKGEESFYRRRKPEDGRIDIEKTIKEQFNLLRISDNEKYPAFFEMDGQKFKLAITKIEE